MQGTPFQKLLLLMTLAAIAAALLLQFAGSRLKPKIEEPGAAKSARPEFKHTYPPPAPKANQPAEAEEEADGPAQPKIARDKAEAWVAKHNRNAASLLAAFRALGDTNLLLEAATNFPNDPQVQLAVLSREVFPEDRRKWLESFKASAPDNSLANYLSAADYFKAGKSDEAMQELQSAAGKEQFQNYAMEAILNGEELYTDAGTKPQLMVSHVMADAVGENLPQLRDFRNISKEIGEAIVQNPASAAELAQLGLDFTGKINSGDSGKFLINQLIGAASEQIILSKLDQNTAYAFLNGQTPAQVTADYKQQKAELRKLMDAFSPAQLQMMQSDSETAHYMQRLKIYGEIEAMKWLIQQHPPPDPAK